MPLWGKKDTPESLPKYLKGVAKPDNVVFEDNANIYQDAFAGMVDPSNRPGWYFTNTVKGNKVNWYLFDGTEQTVTVSDVTFYTVVTLDSVANKPFIMFYTMKQGAGDASSWYRSRYACVIPDSAVVGKKYLAYYGTDPVDIHPELPHISLSSNSSATVGPKGPNEVVLMAGVGSDSAASANTVKFVVESFGMRTSTISRREVNPRIRVTYNNPANNEAPKGDLGNLYFVDASEVALARSKGITGPGWWKYTTYTTSTGKVRHKAECIIPLYATKQVAGDRDDVSVLPNGTISISVQPSDVSVASGVSATFSVTASASDNSQISYQWQKSTDGVTFTNIANAKSASYSVTASNTNNGNKFRVIVKAYGLDSVTSNAATLTVS